MKIETELTVKVEEEKVLCIRCKHVQLPVSTCSFCCHPDERHLDYVTGERRSTRLCHRKNQLGICEDYEYRGLSWIAKLLRLKK